METERLILEPSGYKAAYLLPYEDFDEREFFKWLTDNWSLPIVCSIIYVMVIFGLKEFMKTQPAFSLKGPLSLWNSGLAIFSIFGAYRMNQELYWVLTKHGIQHALCETTYCQTPFGLWVSLFALSKIVELGDTVFIVLRKRPLIFLHWFHHVLTLLYVWAAYMERAASGRWFITMNYNVHALMYSYYALSAMGFRLPKKVSITITTLQTMQMVVGLVVNTSVLFIKKSGRPCHQSYGNIVMALAMYFLYFCLFSLFFYNAYIVKKAKPASPSSKSHSKKNGYQNGTRNVVSNGTAKKHM